MTETPRKPLPEIRPDTKAFWDGTKNGEFRIQTCVRCGQRIYPPRAVCPSCLHTVFEWVTASGKGEVYSYTVVYQAADKSFNDDIPYVYAIIDLEEGVRVVSNVVNTDPKKVSIGMRVKVVFERESEEITVPRFEPVQE